MQRTFLTLFLAIMTAVNAQEAAFRLDFAGAAPVELHNAVIQDGVLQVKGKKSYAAIHGSENINITDNGLTLACVVKFNEQQEKGQDIISKDGAILFARNGKGMLYFGCHDGRCWHAVSGGNPIPSDEWMHLVLVVERVNDPARGLDGFRFKAFANGELAANHLFTNIKPAVRDGKIILGYGNGKELWVMNGQFAEALIYDCALSDAEVDSLVRLSTKIKLKRPDNYTLSPTLRTKLSQARQYARSPESRWAVAALERAAMNGADQTSLTELLQSAIPILGKAQNIAELAEGWNALQGAGRIIATGDLAGLVLQDVRGPFFPLAGLYDGIGRREILTSHGLYWKLAYRQKNSRPVNVNNYDLQFERTVAVDGNAITVVWCNALLKVETKLLLAGSRLESTILAESLDDEVLIFNVTWPGVLLAPMDPARDYMLHPFDQVVQNPAQNSFRVPNSQFYPSSHVPMQFSAYYDDKSGVYVAHEDPHGAMKRFLSHAQEK